MGLPQNNGTAGAPAFPSTGITLPIYKLSKSPIVLLPGILYRVTFSNQDASNFLNFYKNPKLHNLLIANLPKQGLLGVDEKNAEKVSKDSIQGSRALRKFLNGNQGNEGAYDWLIVGLLSQLSNDKVATISRIVGIVNDSKSIVITFQALTRGEVLLDDIEDTEPGFPFEAKIKAISNHVDLGTDYLHEKVPVFNKVTDELFDKIEHFMKEYSLACTFEKSIPQGKKYALTLSPLASALYQQFSNDFKNSWQKLINLIEKFNGNLDKLKSIKNSETFLKLLDLTIAVLPTAKLEFLGTLTVETRFDTFVEILQNFIELFNVLDKSVEYVENYYSKASDLEKSKIISNQLKSIKFSLDSIKPEKSSNYSPGTNTPTNRSNPFSGASSSNNSEEAEELQIVDKFINNIPSDVHPDGRQSLTKDYKRLKRMPTQHSEYQVLRTYFDVILDIPFGQYINSKEIEISKAQKQLDDDHYGLHHVKKRLLQYLSVLKLHDKNNLDESPNSPNELVKKPSSSSPILLFVGPPGVGKTSLARSIATALGRKFQRVSLGGVRDESEIRGHRRTYVGSLPGVIISALRKAGSMNPVILLDEIDKVSGGTGSNGKISGDPAAALLEVLDPEQNCNFTDHYIGFPVDLSQVLFLCTANELATISPPLRDRVEIVEISGYTAEEKVNIGSKYLLPKQIKLNGLPEGEVLLNESIWKKIVLEYIREPGVRNLERTIAAICRGKAVEFVENEESNYNPNIDENSLVKYIGLPIHPISKDLILRPKLSNHYGVVNGLSYNSDGSGGVLVFEVINIPLHTENSKSPTLIITGRLGETLTESIKIGLSFIKSTISRNLIHNLNSTEVLKQFNNSELHLHVPMGGIPKDGPSAGITITLALLSIALSKPVDPTIAMTGEITLRGKVLPIGGVGEKLLGASLFGIKTVLIPKLNRKDVIEHFYNDDDTKLVEFLNKGTDEPEVKVKEKLGIEIIYVDTFWDVIKAVWGNDVELGVDQILESHA